MTVLYQALLHFANDEKLTFLCNINNNSDIEKIVTSLRFGKGVVKVKAHKTERLSDILSHHKWRIEIVRSSQSDKGVSNIDILLSKILSCANRRSLLPQKKNGIS